MPVRTVPAWMPSPPELWPKEFSTVKAAMMPAEEPRFEVVIPWLPLTFEAEIPSLPTLSPRQLVTVVPEIAVPPH